MTNAYKLAAGSDNVHPTVPAVQKADIAEGRMEPRLREPYELSRVQLVARGLLAMHHRRCRCRIRFHVSAVRGQRYAREQPRRGCSAAHECTYHRIPNRDRCVI